MFTKRLSGLWPMNACVCVCVAHARISFCGGDGVEECICVSSNTIPLKQLGVLNRTLYS